MCHSVGVSRISSPFASTTRFAARSMVKSGVDDDRLLVGRRGAAQRGAQAGEQLVHAERLGDEVVGAGVERRDLVAPRASRTDSTMTGTCAPAPEALDDLDTVDAGETEVEDDDVGVVAAPRARAPARRSRPGRPRSRGPGG